MAITFKTNAEDALLTLLNTELDIPVILGHENGPEPEGDYGVIYITQYTNLHRDSNHTYSSGPDTLTELTKQTMVVQFTCMFYGDTCFENAFKANGLFKSRMIQENLYWENDLALQQITQIRNIPELRETQFIPKASFDVSFLTCFQFEQDIDWFDTASYEGNYLDPAGDIVITQEGTISSREM